MSLKAGRIGLGLLLTAIGGMAQISIPSVGTPVTQNFDGLAVSGTSSTVPSGWAFSEAGANANSIYTAGTGSSNAGDSYSFGSAASTERAFGGLQSGNLVPTIGASFVNNTGTVINGLAISYKGEQWRIGSLNRADRLNFEYSLDATSLTTGSWISVAALNFAAPTITGPTGALDGNAAANQTLISSTISSLNIASGATVWIRWTSFDATGADDGLAIDDFSLTAQGTGGSTCPSISLSPTSLPSGTQGVLYSQALSASGGVGPYSFAVTGGGLPAGINLSGNTISGTHSGSGTFPVTVTATDSSTPTTCTGTQAYSLVIAPVVTTTAIYNIQGTGLSSPVVGQTVTTNGVVTALRSNGFYLQDPVGDGNPQTSDGIFVFTSSAPTVAAGQSIQFTGTVVEFTSSTDLLGGSTTQLTTVTGLSILGSGFSIAPTPIDSTLLSAGGGTQQLERFEGMRVSLPSMTVVAPTNGNVAEASASSSSNGTFVAVFSGVATPFREAGIQAPLVAPACEGPGVCAIPVFDNNPERIQIDSDRITGSPALNLRVGQTVSGLVGIFEYGFGVNQVFPDTTSLPVVSGDGVAEGVAPVAKASEVTVATYNMERFFDTVDAPGVSDVVLSNGALANRLNKASLGIRVNLGAPDIIGVQEIENLTVLQALASKLNLDAAGAYTYTSFLFEGNDPGGIDVGFLVKNTVSVSSVTQLGQAATYTNPCTFAADLLNDRPPVVMRATVTKAGRSLDLAVIVNHLRSLNGISDDAGGGCTGGQRVRAKRAAQAEFLANFIQTEITANPNVKLISVGDMNAFEVNDGYVDVIGTVTGNPTAATQVADASADLVNPNLFNLLNAIPDPAQRFSYVFDGNHQTLDHLLYTQGLRDQVTNGGYVRINSEFPETDRNDSNSARRLSDHDPGVIYVTTAQPVVSGILVQRGGLILNRTTNTYNGNLVIRNTGTVALTGPFTVALTGLPVGVSVANATGTSYQGSYLVNSATTIAAGGALLVPVQFSNPGNVAINYTTKVYSGAF